MVLVMFSCFLVSFFYLLFSNFCLSARPHMPTPIILPELGTEAVRLSVWFVDPGDLVYEGDRVVEVLSNGATFDVLSPVTGRLIEKKAHADDSLVTGQVLGMVEVERADK
jgi:pyruvate/2-oxoglutarate dehydrogenase complex dihydrolipoamide acyltransferase (E2) component